MFLSFCPVLFLYHMWLMKQSLKGCRVSMVVKLNIIWEDVQIPYYMATQSHLIVSKCLGDQMEVLQTNLNLITFIGKVFSL